MICRSPGIAHKEALKLVLIERIDRHLAPQKGLGFRGVFLADRRRHRLRQRPEPPQHMEMIGHQAIGIHVHVWPQISLPLLQKKPVIPRLAKQVVIPHGVVVDMIYLAGFELRPVVGVRPGGGHKLE